MAWLIALRVGIVCVRRSKSIQRGMLLQEAALAGAWFGLLQGLLFWVFVPLMGPIKTSEQASTIGIIIFVVVVGMVVGAVLSWFTAYNIERRKQSS
jgi:hypothetical protein